MKIIVCLLSCILCFSEQTCLKERIDALKEEALLFVQQEQFAEPGSEELILQEIFTRLEDPALWADPQKYQADWTEERGFTREFRIPEDAARIFFDAHVFHSTLST